jgi:hypothetical protein
MPIDVSEVENDVRGEEEVLGIDYPLSWWWLGCKAQILGR